MEAICSTCLNIHKFTDSEKKNGNLYQNKYFLTELKWVNRLWVVQRIVLCSELHVCAKFQLNWIMESGSSLIDQERYEYSLTI